MSGWRTTVLQIDPSSPILLEIEVRDRGDQLMDTQVLIGAITMASVIPASLVQGSDDCVDAAAYCEALFPLPGTFSGNGNPQDPPWMCEIQPDRTGENTLKLREPNDFRGGAIQSIVADGVTRMPFIPVLSEARDEVVISIASGDVPADGGLGSFGSFERLPEITVPVVELSPGSWAGQAQYFAPESYWRPELDLGADYGPTRLVQLNFCFQNVGGADQICSSVFLGIARPDLVMMHGLWSDWTAWNLKLQNSGNIKSFTHDYSTKNASRFSVNRFEPQQDLESIHTLASENPAYSDRLFCGQTGGMLTCPNGAGSDLINAEGTGRFAFFPSPASFRESYRGFQIPQGARTDGAQLVGNGIRITTPAPGQPVEAGAIVQVTVESVPPFVASRVMLMSKIGVEVVEEPPFEFTVTVPGNLIGALEFSAIGEDAAGNYSTAEAIAVIGQTQAKLTNLLLSPEAVFLNGFDDRRQLFVTGVFNDDLERNLTNPSTGTVYTSSDPATVSVSAEGLLRPRKDGTVTIIASNGGLQKSISVEVMDIGNLMFRDSFEAAGFIVASSGP